MLWWVPSRSRRAVLGRSARRAVRSWLLDDNTAAGDIADETAMITHLLHASSGSSRHSSILRSESTLLRKPWADSIADAGRQTKSLR
jgi:hypothetical protein